jgi:hypothetical protein
MGRAKYSAGFRPWARICEGIVVHHGSDFWGRPAFSDSSMVHQATLIGISSLYSQLYETNNDIGNTYEGQHAIWVLDESSEVNPVVYPPGH